LAIIIMHNQSLLCSFQSNVAKDRTSKNVVGRLK
jgi:hypothetical protein